MTWSTVVAKARRSQEKHANHGVHRHLMPTAMLILDLGLMGTTITAETQVARRRRYGATPMILQHLGNYVNQSDHQFSMTLMMSPTK